MRTGSNTTGVVESAAGLRDSMDCASYGRSAVLGTITQERGHGGIARVSILLWRAMEELVGRERRLITLLEASSHPGFVDKLRFATQMWAVQGRQQARWVLFDHLGIAAVQNLIPVGRRAPYAVFLHSLEAWCPLPEWKKRVLRSARVRIANSRYTAARIAQVHPDIGSIDVCHLALLESAGGFWDMPVSERPDPELVSRLGPHAVLIVGRTVSNERHKGHEQLIAAWPLIRQAVPDATLVIAGTGDDLPRFQAMAAEAGQAGSILFPGRVSDATLNMLYAHSSVFAMPARGEGFGLVYLEAMRHSLPCVAGIHDAAGEVVEQGATGFLVDQGNREQLAKVVTQLLQNPSLRKEMGEAGLRRLRTHFSFDQFKSRLATAIAPLLSWC